MSDLPECHGDVCITCSDEAVQVRVVRLLDGGPGRCRHRRRAWRRSASPWSTRPSATPSWSTPRRPSPCVGGAVVGRECTGVRVPLPLPLLGRDRPGRRARRRCAAPPWRRRPRSSSCARLTVQPGRGPAGRLRQGRWPGRSARGGRLFTFGNGGSSTDAQDGGHPLPAPPRGGAPAARALADQRRGRGHRPGQRRRLRGRLRPAARRLRPARRHRASACRPAATLPTSSAPSRRRAGAGCSPSVSPATRAARWPSSTRSTTCSWSPRPRSTGSRRPRPRVYHVLWELTQARPSEAIRQLLTDRIHKVVKRHGTQAPSRKSPSSTFSGSTPA